MTESVGHWAGTVAISALVALVVSTSLVWWLLRNARWLGLFDEPNHRSLHERVVPRSGGVGVLVAIVSGWGSIALVSVVVPSGWWMIVVGLMAVAGVSLLDDLRNVQPLARMSVHLFAGMFLVLAGLALPTLQLPGFVVHLGPVLSSVLTLLFISWFINLFNFMDGMDGLAGGMAFFGFTALAVLGVIGGEYTFACACGAVAGAAVGFLFFNFPPAQIFLGDVGSAPLGYLSGSFVVWADYSGVAPLWVGVMIFAPFFLDASVTLLRRLRRRERVWEAHRSHYYQRSVRAGSSQQRTVLAEYALMAGCGVTAVLVLEAPAIVQWFVIGGWSVVFMLCALHVHIRERIADEARAG